MQRREFITFLGGAAAWPLAAYAQYAGKVYRIGFLSYRGCVTSLDPFRRGLRELGYIEGKNLVLECRDAPGRVENFPDLAGELVRLKIDVLVTEGTPATMAARHATTTTPIVMVGVADPVLSGLVTSLARPGGNVTGPSLYPTLEVATTALQLAKEVIPAATRIALLRDQYCPVWPRASAPRDCFLARIRSQRRFVVLRTESDFRGQTLGGLCAKGFKRRKAGRFAY